MEIGEDLLFLEREFLDGHRVGNRDFQDTAAEASGVSVFGQSFSHGGSPGGGEIGIGLDATVTAGGD